jgi:hypothetical protein
LSPHLQAQTVSDAEKEPLVQSKPVQVTSGEKKRKKEKKK